MRAPEHAPRGPFRVLERRHGLAEIVERGAVVPVKRLPTNPPHFERDFIRLAENASRYGNRFVHQRLDVEGNYGIHSAPAVRKILEDSGQVAAVFQGHNHVNEHKTINDVHYLTINAVIEGPAPENNAFSILEYSPSSQAIRVDGFYNQANYSL